MNSHAINTRRRSKHLAGIALVCTAVLFTPRTSTAQQLQQGVSVQLAVTSSATSMPAADNEDAMIVAVTNGGSVYFGINPVPPAALAEKIKLSLSNREQKLYIKADARTQYASVLSILEAARAANVAAPILLTAQSESPQPGTMVSPQGLEVLVAPPAPGSQAAVVQVRTSDQHGTTLTINHQQIPMAALQNTLKQLFQNRSEKVVLLEAAGQLPFAHVVNVIDACRSMGAKVVLVTPDL